MAEGERYIRVQGGCPCELERAALVRRDLHGKKIVVLVRPGMKRRANLLQVAGTSGSPSLRAATLDHRQQQRREDGDDGNCAKQFEQREGRTSVSVACAAHYGIARRMTGNALAFKCCCKPCSVTCCALPSANPMLPARLCISVVQPA